MTAQSPIVPPPGATAAAEGFREHIFHAADDVAIYYRDYGDPAAAAVPVLCLSGLTRNSGDFAPLARHLAPKRRVLCMDYRGRGRSGYDPNWQNYNPRTYVTDVLELLKVADIAKVALVGTSLGGICAMGLAAVAPTRLAGVVLNDVGPVVNTEGLSRIAGYVGKEVRMPSLEAAALALQTQFAGAYPGTDQAFWLENAETVFVRDEAAGNYRLDYDLNIGQALRAQAGDTPPDLWPLYKALQNIPVLAVRGALSDLLDQPTFDRMAAEKPDLQRLLIPNRGHTPIPHEEPFLSTLEAFLDRL